MVKGEKHFPVFEGKLVFKPLTKSKPFSGPLFAYAEVFWSWLIDTYFMFPDNLQRNRYWFEQLQRSIRGEEVRPDEYDYMTNKSERQLMEKSAVCLHKNLLYIKKNYPKACNTFLKKLDILQKDIKENKDWFSLKKAPGYPDMANSDAYLIGKAKYKDHDEKKSGQYEELFGKGWKEIDFETVSNVAVGEIQQVIQQIILCMR